MCLGAIASGILGASSADSAADAQIAAAEQQIDLERDIYNDTVERFEPFYETGLDYNNALRFELLGGERPVFGGEAPRITVDRRTVPGQPRGGGPRNVLSQNEFWNGEISALPRQNRTVKTFRVGDEVFHSRKAAEEYAENNRTGGYEYRGFEATPGYQFALDQGQAAIDGSAAARGNVFSGATLKAQQRFGTGLAQQEYGNYLNRLAGQTAQGQAAAGNIATAGSNFASGAGTAYANIGDARAAGHIAGANALGDAINTGFSAWGYMNPQASNGIRIPRNLMADVNGVI